jgi:hypothetical protein
MIKPSEESPMAEASKIWKCEFCEQELKLNMAGGRPKLPTGYYDNCLLKEHFVGDECIAFRDPDAARRLISQGTWRVNIVEHFDGRDRVSTKECKTAEEAFKYACSQRHSSSGLSIDGPDEQYDEAQIDEWCRQRGL